MNTLTPQPEEVLSKEEKELLGKLISQETRIIRQQRGPNNEEIEWSKTDKDWFEKLNIIKNKLKL